MSKIIDEFVYTYNNASSSVHYVAMESIGQIHAGQLITKVDGEFRYYTNNDSDFILLTEEEIAVLNELCTNLLKESILELISYLQPLDERATEIIEDLINLS